MTDDDQVLVIPSGQESNLTPEQIELLVRAARLLSIRLLGGVWRADQFITQIGVRPAADGIALALIFEHGAIPVGDELCDLVGRQLGVEIAKLLKGNAAAAAAKGRLDS